MQHAKDSNPTFRMLAISAIMSNLCKFSNEKVVTEFAPILVEEINLELSIGESWIMPQLTSITGFLKETPLATKENAKTLLDFFNVPAALIIGFASVFQS